MRVTVLRLLIAAFCFTNPTAFATPESQSKLALACYLYGLYEDDSVYVVLKPDHKPIYLIKNETFSLDFDLSWVKPYAQGIDITYLGELDFKHIFSFAVRGTEAYTLDEGGRTIPLINKIPVQEGVLTSYPVIGVSLGDGSYGWRFIHCNMNIEKN